MQKGEICPIFKVSSLSGFGINQLNYLLKKMKSRNADNPDIGDLTDEVEFDIHDKFTVVGTGLVLTGLLRAGTLTTN